MRAFVVIATKGRVNDVGFGYSQIANVLYLMKKGTMEYKVGLRVNG